MFRPRTMGQVYADILLIGPTGRRKPMRLLVDTGSTYTWIHGATLMDLGVAPERERTFRTIERIPVTRPSGHAVVEHEGQVEPTVVVFARATDAEVLGLLVLEAMGLEVDPVNHRLKESEAILALAVLPEARDGLEASSARAPKKLEAPA